MRILICDDIDARATDIKQIISATNQPNITVDLLTEQSLTKGLEDFFAKIRPYLLDPANAALIDDNVFNGYDLVIIDNNLAELAITGAILTAETIAGYVRSFSTSRYLISLNKNPDVDFDLRYLVGDFTTHADLALNVTHLRNNALWTGLLEDAEKGFLPWYWPKLNTVSHRRQSQFEFLHQRLLESVTSTFGFSKKSIQYLSAHAQGTLDPEAKALSSTDDGKTIDQVTFCDVFLAKDRSLPIRSERTAIVAAFEAGSADAAKVIARVVTADIDLWFRRDVIGPQEALVDIPHLLLRMPFLLGDKSGDINYWNQCLKEHVAPFGLAADVFEGQLATARFEYGDWAPTPAFWWPSLKDNDALNELFFNANSNHWADVVFCEDQSIFVERSPGEGDPVPVEFSAEFEGSWGRRHVTRLNNIKYAPRTRLAQ
jgi:hypothetical protein